jgi:uncharacterized membrane protein required for colicin V production
MNLYDLLVLIVLALLALRGLRRGLLATFLGLVAFAAGVFLGLRYDDALGGLLRGHLGLTATEARIVAFLVIILAVGVVFRLVVGLLSGLIRRTQFVGAINRLGGLAVGMIVGCLTVWLVTAALLLVPYWLVPFSAAVHHSETAHMLAHVTPHWDTDLRAYLDNFTAGRPSSALQRELRRLSVEHLLSLPRP